RGRRPPLCGEPHSAWCWAAAGRRSLTALLAPAVRLRYSPDPARTQEVQNDRSPATIRCRRDCDPIGRGDSSLDRQSAGRRERRKTVAADKGLNRGRVLFGTHLSFRTKSIDIGGRRACLLTLPNKRKFSTIFILKRI